MAVQAEQKQDKDIKALHETKTALSCVYQAVESGNVQKSAFHFFHNTMLLFAFAETLRQASHYELSMELVGEAEEQILRETKTFQPAEIRAQMFIACCAIKKLPEHYVPEVFEFAKSFRNKFLEKRNDAFAHLLLHSPIEFKSPYSESAHKDARFWLKKTDATLGSESIQLELAAGMDEFKVKKIITDYYCDRNFKATEVQEGVMIYEKQKQKLIESFIISVVLGHERDVMMITWKKF